MVCFMVTFPVFSQTENGLPQEKNTKKLDSLKEKLADFNLAKWTHFSEAKKIKYMSLKAEEIVLMLGPGFYYEDQNTIIEKDVVIKKGQSINDNILGEKVYKVNFQKKSDENTDRRYAATIQFLKRTGKAYRVSFGNMMGLRLDSISPYDIYSQGIVVKNTTEGMQSTPESEAYFKKTPGEHMEEARKKNKGN